jgi:hypothetical protein
MYIIFGAFIGALVGLIIAICAFIYQKCAKAQRRLRKN